jgi:ABC-2 type transport system permease protein
MRPILILLRKDFALFFANRAAIGLTFLVPVAMIYIFGQVFGLNRRDLGPTGITLAVVNQSAQPAAQKLIGALQAEKSFSVVTQFINPDRTARPLAEADLRPMMHENQFRYAVVIPADLLRTDGIGVHLKILSNPRNVIEVRTVDGLLQKTIMASVPELLTASLQANSERVLGADRFHRFNGGIAAALAAAYGGDRGAIQRRIEAGDWWGASGEAADPTLRRLDLSPAEAKAAADSTPIDLLSRLVKIDAESVSGRDVKSPVATSVVGGWSVMFMMFLLTGSAATFFDEKRTGVYQRILSAPVSRAQLLWSRFFHGVILGVLQQAMLFGAGQALYGIDVIGHFGKLLLVCVAGASACTAFGMLVAAITRTPQAAFGLASFLILTMCAVGGAWFPVSFMPELMQHLAKFTLVYWTMEGFAQVLWEGYTVVELLPTLGLLFGIAAIVMAASVWRFNRSKIFA